MQLAGNREFAVPVSKLGADRSADSGSSDAQERQLIQRIAVDRDARALERLYVLYSPRLSRFLRRLTSDRQVIEEVCNDVLWVVWKQAGGFRGGSKVSTWIFTIAYRTGIKLLKKSNWRPEDNGETFDKITQTLAAEPSNELENSDLIATALQRLSPKHRMVVELSYFFDHSYDDIAEIAQCPVNTVKTRMFHARRQLRDIVDQLS